MGILWVWPQRWQVVAMWGSRRCLSLVWLLRPWMRTVPQPLHMPRLMCVGSLVRVRWAMRLRSWVYLRLRFGLTVYVSFALW